MLKPSRLNVFQNSWHIIGGVSLLFRIHIPIKMRDTGIWKRFICRDRSPLI